MTTFDQLNKIAPIISQGFDNLFSANHRAAMMRQHGGTQAQIIKVQFNKLTEQAEIIY